ncbi:MAG: LysM peptidoglycan-binding domain-containing protein [Chloroflexi bacterium]|nr:LysM peptidoglycan-binding domain-containing protein [Chloroflexota bacterium]
MRTLRDLWQRLRLPQLRTRLPHFPFQRGSAIAFLLLAVSTFGNAWLITALVLPTFETRSKLAEQLQTEQRNLIAARDLREDSPETIEKRIASNQAIVQQAQKQLLANDQLTALANAVYQHANTSGIALTELAVSGGPAEASVLKFNSTPTRTPTLAGSGVKPTTKPIATSRALTTTRAVTATVSATATALPLLYQIRRLHLQAQGATQRLINFMARLREFQTSGVVVETLTMTGKAEWATLTLKLALYVDPAAPAKLPPVQTIKNITTPLPPQTASPAFAAPLQTPTPYVIIVPYGNAGVMPTLTPTPERLYVYYVQSGDTLSTLAQKFHVPAQEIVNRNALTILELTPGQKLLIPVR